VAGVYDRQDLGTTKQLEKQRHVHQLRLGVAGIVLFDGQETHTVVGRNRKKCHCT